MQEAEAGEFRDILDYISRSKKGQGNIARLCLKTIQMPNYNKPTKIS